MSRMLSGRDWRGVPLLVIALTLAGMAQAADPVIIVSVKSYNELMADAAYLGETVGQPVLPLMLQGAISGATGGSDLAGLDKDRPIGAFMGLDENGNPGDPIIFVPVSNSRQFNATLGKMFKKKSTEEGITEFEMPNGLPVFGSDEEDWYFFAQKEEALDDLPKPALLVKSKADISIEVDVDRIPQPLKQHAIAEIEAQAANEPADSEAEKFGQQLGVEVMKQLVTETARYTLSLDINAQKKFVAIDTGLTARRGTSLATAYDSYGKLKSTFTDLETDDTVASLVFAFPLSKQIQQALVKALEDGANEAKQKAGKGNAKHDKLAQRMIDVMKRTLMQDHIDSAIVVNNLDDQLQIAAALGVADGDELSDLFDEAAADAKEPDLELNVEEYDETSIHSVAMKVKDAQAKELLGDEPLYFAFGSDRIVIGLGVDGIDGVKAGLDAELDEDSDRPPLSLRVSLGSALPLAKNEGNAAIIERAEEILADGDDEIALEVTPQTRGVKLHFEIQEAVLKLIRLAQPGQ